MGPGRMQRERPWQAPSSPIEGLYYSGFIFGAFASHGEGSHEELVVPAELLRHLPAESAPPPRLALQVARQPPMVMAATDWLLDDMCTLLSYIQNNQPHLGPDGRWLDRHEAQMIGQLRVPDGARLALLRHVVAALGWAHSDGSGKLRLDPNPVVAWLQAGSGMQRVTLAAAWAEDSEWNDLHHTPGLAFDDTGSWRNDPLSARKAILDHLSTLTPETWHTITDLVSSIKEVDPDFQRPDGDYSSWYVRDACSGEYLSGFECWDRVEAALVHFLVAGPLAWLGLVDLGAERCSGSPTLFRLTADGASFLRGNDVPASPPPDHVVVRADLTIGVPAAARYQRFQLGRVADLVRTADRYTYRISGESLSCGKRQGIPTGRVLEFLREAAGEPLPHSLELAVTNWEKHGCQVAIEQVVVLRLSDEGLMDRALSAAPTRALVQERIGPTTALVRRRDWRRLVAALAAQGMLSNVTGIDEQEGGS
jgi:hypothetical protein